MLYGVCRISVDTRESVSIETQQSTIRAYCDQRFGRGAIVTWIIDRGVSGSVPILSRPAGSALAQVRRGDHVIVSKLDRAFRSMSDGAATIDRLERQGVGLHAIDLQLDTSSPVGRVVMHVMIAFAQLERERIGERRRDANRLRRESGLPWASQPPVGWRHVRIDGVRYFQPVAAERRLARRLLKLWQAGYSIPGIIRICHIRAWLNRGRAFQRSSVRQLIYAAEDGFPLMSRKCRGWGSGRPRACPDPEAGR